MLSSLEASLALECLHMLRVTLWSCPAQAKCMTDVEAGVWAGRFNQPLWRVHVATASHLKSNKTAGFD